MRLGFDYLSRGPNCAQSVMRAYWAVVDGARLGGWVCVMVRRPVTNRLEELHTLPVVSAYRGSLML